MLQYDLNASIIDQMGTLMKEIVEKFIELETTTLKIVEDNYERKKIENLMDTIGKDRVTLSKEISEAKTILKEVGQLVIKVSKLSEFTDDLEKFKQK